MYLVYISIILWNFRFILLKLTLFVGGCVGDEVDGFFLFFQVGGYFDRLQSWLGKMQCLR